MDLLARELHHVLRAVADVDEADAQRLAENWGQGGATWVMGDFNDDGVVGPADACILAANWGYTSGSETTCVPEPSILALLLGVSLMLLPRRRP